MPCRLDLARGGLPVKWLVAIAELSLLACAAGAAEPPQYFLRADGTVEKRVQKREKRVSDLEKSLNKAPAKKTACDCGASGASCGCSQWQDCKCKGCQCQACPGGYDDYAKVYAEVKAGKALTLIVGDAPRYHAFTALRRVNAAEVPGVKPGQYLCRRGADGVPQMQSLAQGATIAQSGPSVLGSTPTTVPLKPLFLAPIQGGCQNGQCQPTARRGLFR